MRIFQCRIAMLVGYFQDGENLTVWLIESTDGGNPSIFVDCLFHARLSERAWQYKGKQGSKTSPCSISYL